MLATTTPPLYYLTSCAHNTCPENTTGDNVFAGCTCKAGTVGKVVATFIAPTFYNFTGCTMIPCPNGSMGENLRSGCTCNAGLLGTISATTIGPSYYTGVCRTITLTAPDVRFLIVAGGGGGKYFSTLINLNLYVYLIDYLNLS